MQGRALTQCLSDALLPNPPKRLGIAVSGGGDSTALLHLAARFCANHAIKPFAVTVNHNLRADAAAEAAQVAATCRDIGVTHDTLEWHDPGLGGNLQSKARAGRYRLMTDWAGRRDIGVIALGHTGDDQAETVLMHLARRSGVDGLAGMLPRRIDRGVTWIRPLLSARRQDLRDFLKAEGLCWIDDPTNDDMSFDRIKARTALKSLADLGIDAPGLCEVASNMADVRRALNWQAFTVARDITCIDGGAVVIAERGLRILPDEIQRRILLGALSWISGAVYPPRRAAVGQMMQALRDKQAMTISGCHLIHTDDKIWLFREFEAVRQTTTACCTVWDKRWSMVAGPPHSLVVGGTLRALGEDGLAACENWRETGRPRAMLLSSPSLWSGGKLVAAPLAGEANNWRATLNEGEDAFYSGFLAH